VVPRHRSFTELFIARLLSPISRLRRGILRGPEIGDCERVKQGTLLAIGIDGSITIVKDTTEYNIALFEWLEEYFSRPNNKPRLPLPGTSRNFMSDK
jgi:hypothetical protein